MRLYTVLIVLTFICLISITINDCIYTSVKLGKKEELVRTAYTEKYFIAESFKNACQNKGFSSLEEWQVCCRKMFNLEYIAWCPCNEFMIDEAASDENCLMYGKWIASSDNPQASGEVYCRMKRGSR